MGVTGNNFRFLLEGFLINLEIAAIGIVFSLIFGLLLALMRISKRPADQRSRPGSGSTSGATCR